MPPDNGKVKIDKLYLAATKSIPALLEKLSPLLHIFFLCSYKLVCVRFPN
jgi:hypothetical protein